MAGDAELTEAHALAELGKWGSHEVRDDKCPERPVIGIISTRKLVTEADGRSYTPTFTEEEFPLLAAFESLRFLDIQESGVTSLRSASNLRRLISLGLPGAALNPANLADIGRLNGLSELKLNLEGWSPTRGPGLDEIFRALGEIKTLQSLSVSGLSIIDSELEALHELRNLSSLTLERLRITPAGQHALGGLSKLTTLRLRRTLFLDAVPAWNALGGLKHLQELSFHDAGLDDAALTTVANFEQLSRLELKEHAITDAGLGALGRRSSLRCLVLDCPATTDRGLSEISPLEELKMLALQSVALSSECWSQISKLKALTLLDLSTTTIDDAELKRLAELGSLTSLFLGHTDTANAGLQAIGTLSGLRTLSIAHTGITDSGLAELRNLSQLSALDLYNTRITTAGLKQLPALPSLKLLFLSEFARFRPQRRPEILGMFPAATITNGWISSDWDAADWIVTHRSPKRITPAASGANITAPED